jgi:transposase
MEEPLADRQPALIELAPQPGIAIGHRLRLISSDRERVIFLGGTAIARFTSGDKASEDAAIALLASARAASEHDLAQALGRHRNTISRLRGRMERGGIAAVVPAKRGPKGPYKVTAELLELVAAHAERPLSELEQRTRDAGFVLSRSHLHRLQRRARQARGPQPALPVAPELEGVAAVAEQPPAPTECEATAEASTQSSAAVAPLAEPPVRLPEQARGRELGASLYFPALHALGLLEAALACFRLPGAERFGVRATTLTLFFLTVCGKPTVEAAKHLRRWEFGPLVGAGRAPVVRTLRRKLGELVRQGEAARFGTLLARRWVEQGLVATAYLYVDGHMQAYTGKRRLAEVWNAQRRMPLPGVLTHYVNDVQGRPLLFVTDEANASLAQAMPEVVRAIREVLGERPFTVIFDRGGYDSGLFTWLVAEHIDFITYQRGSPERPVAAFQRRECRFEGRRVRMQLAEDRVRVAQSGPWRRVVVRTKDGHQTPILTSLEQLPAARVACLMFARWRQENFFKYAGEHQGLDRLLGYAWAEADGARLVPNPERTHLARELRAKRAELSALRAALGQVLLDEPRDASRTAHGLKIAQHGAVGRLREVEAELQALLARRSALPERIPLAEAGPRQIMCLEQKQLIDRIKITAYNAEEWLLDLLLRHYPNPHDARALLRSFAALAGEMRTTAHAVAVTLDAPDIPLHRRALRALCDDLNALGTVYPGTNLPVTYAVALHHSELAA